MSAEARSTSTRVAGRTSRGRDLSPSQSQRPMAGSSRRSGLETTIRRIAVRQVE